MDSGTTNAACECSGLEPAARLEGRGLRIRGRPGISIVDLTSSRGMAGERGVPRCTQRRESDGRHRQRASIF